MPNVNADNVTYLLRPAADPPYELHGPDPTDIAVGWDVGRATFFAHVSKDYPGTDGNSYRSEAVRVGTAPYEVNTARDILNLVRPWAVVPPDLERVLEAAAGPHEARQATVWATNEHPGYGLAGWHVDLGDPTHGGDLISGPFEIARQPEAPDWTVRATPYLADGAVGPVAVIRRQGGFTRDDALFTAARLAASGRIHKVFAFQGEDDRHASQFTEWRFEFDWQVGWHFQGLASASQDLPNAIDRAIARVVDGAPGRVAAEAERRWQQPGSANVTALAEAVWQKAMSGRTAPPSLRPGRCSTRRCTSRCKAIPTPKKPFGPCGTKPATPPRAPRRSATTRSSQPGSPPPRATAIRHGVRRATPYGMSAGPPHDGTPPATQPRAGTDRIRGKSSDATLAEKHLATEMLASVSGPPGVAGEHPSRQVGARPAGLAGAFHPTTTTPDATSTTAGTSRQTRPAHRDTPPGGQGPRASHPPSPPDAARGRSPRR